MCRFLGYVGSEILLADLISLPVNSLIRQSYKSRERSEHLNGDGFARSVLAHKPLPIILI